MSLATRCPACGTVFRVVQDQLKVSDGWVRCGRCSEVFNALEGLFDLTRESAPVPLDAPGARGAAPPPPAFSPTAAPASPDLAADVPADFADEAAAMGGPNADDAPAADAEAGAEPPEHTPAASDAPAAGAWATPTAAPDADGRREPAFDDVPPWDVPPASPPPSGALSPAAPDDEAWASTAGRLGDDGAPPDVTPAPSPGAATPPAEPWAGPDADAPGPAPGGHVGGEPAESGDGSLSRPAFEDAQFPADALNEDPPVALSPAGRAAKQRGAPPEAVPGFVRRADRAARWQRPGVRVLLSLLVLALTLALAGQITWHWRDRFAAQQPEWRPWLARTCELAGCTLQPPRRPEALRVESSTLNKAGGDVYRLTVVLRNTADHAVRSPHLDLTLTDNDGAVVARRAIGPELVSGAAPALEAQAEAAWQLTLSSGGRRVSGYTVAAFYP